MASIEKLKCWLLSMYSIYALYMMVKKVFDHDTGQIQVIFELFNMKGNLHWFSMAQDLRKT